MFNRAAAFRAMVNAWLQYVFLEPREQLHLSQPTALMTTTTTIVMDDEITPNPSPKLGTNPNMLSAFGLSGEMMSPSPTDISDSETRDLVIDLACYETMTMTE